MGVARVEDVEAVRTGSPSARAAAFAALVDGQLDAGYRLATFILGDREEAADATQEAAADGLLRDLARVLPPVAAPRQGPVPAGFSLLPAVLVLRGPGQLQSSHHHRCWCLVGWMALPPLMHQASSVRSDKASTTAPDRCHNRREWNSHTRS